MTTTLNASTAGAGGFIATSDNSGSLALQTAGTTAVTIDTSQNVGIGTSSPSGKFDVSGTVVASGLNARITNTDTDASARAAIQFKTGASANVWQAFTRNNQLVFGVSGVADYATIDSSGNLLVGTTTSQAVLTIKGTQQGNQAWLEQSAAGGYCLTTKAYTNGGTYYHAAFNIVGSGTGVGSITSSSTLTSYNVSSDYRLKENIAPLTGALEKIAQLKPSVYNYKSDPTTNIEGFVAHELQSIVPHAVTGQKDAVDSDGNPVYQGVDASFLIPHLVAAIQEQQATINALTARLVALESK
jgi:hypothetical protein